MIRKGKDNNTGKIYFGLYEVWSKKTKRRSQNLFFKLNGDLTRY